MNYESRAIALLNHKYGEGAVIAKIFTEEYGLKSFSVKRNKSKKSKNKILLLEKMNLLTINAKNNAIPTWQGCNAKNPFMSWNEHDNACKSYTRPTENACASGRVHQVVIGP